jgi:beta-galactosidase/beta-glucuronidase
VGLLSQTPLWTSLNQAWDEALQLVAASESATLQRQSESNTNGSVFGNAWSTLDRLSNDLYSPTTNTINLRNPSHAYQIITQCSAAPALISLTQHYLEATIHDLTYPEYNTHASKSDFKVLYSTRLSGYSLIALLFCLAFCF